MPLLFSSRRSRQSTPSRAHPPPAAAAASTALAAASTTSATASPALSGSRLPSIPSAPTTSSPGDAWTVPSRLPFRCSSVLLRGGPLLQGVEVECSRLHLDLQRATLNLQLRWAHYEPHQQRNANEEGDTAARNSHATPHTSPSQLPHTASPADSVSHQLLPPPAILGARKRTRPASSGGNSHSEEEYDEETRFAQTPLSLQLATSTTQMGSPAKTKPRFLATPLTAIPPLPEQSSVHLSKRGRTDERGEATRGTSVFTAPPMGASHADGVASSSSLPSLSSPHHSFTSPGHSTRTLWSIPLSHIVGTDFAISLDQPATCTLALKPHCVYATDPPLPVSALTSPSPAQLHASACATPLPPTFTPAVGSAHHLYPPGRRYSTPALSHLPAYSPARLLVNAYHHMASSDPVKFHRLSRFVQRWVPPLMYWWWLHSTYTACAVLIMGCSALHFRFWLTGIFCLLTYLILLFQEFRRSQHAFKSCLLQHRQPVEECLYVHLVFAHESYTSFLSFRRLFVAAAPAFSAPSASSSGATALIPESLPSSIIWNPTPQTSAVPQRYSLSHLQKVLPVAPLFFGNVYVDFICYLLLSPRVFASSRVRSVTHFLLPVLYLGQAMVAAVRALTPVAVQGFLFLAPHLYVEVHWFVWLLESFLTPLSFLFDLLLPLAWVRHAVGLWLVRMGSLAWEQWHSILSVLNILFAPIRTINAFLSPVLEFIRQEARALWGLSILFQPVLSVIIRLKTELMRMGTAISSFVSLFATLFRGVLPSRLFSLFGALRVGASATASVASSAASASNGVSRWRAMWQSLLDAFSLIGKWKVVVDRVRLNIQVWYYERWLHVQDARNASVEEERGEGKGKEGQTHARVTTSTLDVPLIRHVSAGVPTSPSSSPSPNPPLSPVGGDKEELEGNPLSPSMDRRRHSAILTPRRPPAPGVGESAPPSPLMLGARAAAASPALGADKSQPPSIHSSPMLTPIQWNKPTVGISSPPLATPFSLPSPPAFLLSPVKTEPPFTFVPPSPTASFSGYEAGFQSLVAPPPPPPSASYPWSAGKLRQRKANRQGSDRARTPTLSTPLFRSEERKEDLE